LKSPPAQQAMAERVIAEGLTADDAAKAVRQKKGKAAGAGRGVTETFRLASGFKVVVSANRKATAEEVIEALEGALMQARARTG
ncbi:MAG: hypothetical protein WKF75_12405, partial [Singulisphaera sp.]